MLTAVVCSCCAAILIFFSHERLAWYSIDVIVIVAVAAAAAPVAIAAAVVVVAAQQSTINNQQNEDGYNQWYCSVLLFHSIPVLVAMIWYAMIWYAILNCTLSGGDCGGSTGSSTGSTVLIAREGQLLSLSWSLSRSSISYCWLSLSLSLLLPYYYRIAVYLLATVSLYCHPGWYVRLKSSDMHDRCDVLLDSSTTVLYHIILFKIQNRFFIYSWLTQFIPNPFGVTVWFECTVIV